MLAVKVRDGKTNRFITKRHYIRTNGKQPIRPYSENKIVRQQEGQSSPSWVGIGYASISGPRIDSVKFIAKRAYFLNFPNMIS